MNNIPSLEDCARHFLNQWYVKEKELFWGIRSADENVRRETITKAVTIFRVARNLKRVFDVGEGIPRYQPILVIANRLLTNATPPDPFYDHVESIASEIGCLYGGIRPTSLTSKLLWLIYRDPIIIYDSRVCRALKYKGNSYTDYCHRWLTEYRDLEDRVARTSQTLAESKQLSGVARQAPEDNKAVCFSPWFHKRVFDIYLWHVGSTLARPLPMKRPGTG